MRKPFLQPPLKSSGPSRPPTRVRVPAQADVRQLQDRLRDVSRGLDELRQESLSHDREIDGLQSLARDSPVPWYRSISHLIAVLTFVFSILTFGLSQHWTSTQIRRQEIADSREELRAVLQRLFELRTAGSDSATSELITGENLNREETLLAVQAMEVAARIPDHVASNEYLSIGQSLYRAGRTEDAVGMLDRAIQTATTPQDSITANRASGSILMSLGALEAGRQRYRDALIQPSGQATVDATWWPYQHAQTEVLWASAEIAWGGCRSVRLHLTNARSYNEKLHQPSTLGTYQDMENSITSVERDIATYCVHERVIGPDMLP